MSFEKWLLRYDWTERNHCLKVLDVSSNGKMMMKKAVLNLEMLSLNSMMEMLPL